MSFSFFDICLAIIVSQGIFLSIAIQLVPKGNKKANLNLTLILLMASIICLGRMLYFKETSELLFKIGTIVDASLFLFGPLFYFYFKILLFKPTHNRKIHLAHYIVPLLYCIYTVFILASDIKSIMYLSSSGILEVLFFIIELTGIISVSFYSYLIYRLILVYRKNEPQQISFEQNIIKYVQSILIAIVVFVVIWIISFVSSYAFQYTHAIFNYYTMWLSMALLMYFIGYYSLTQPEIFRMQLELTPKAKSKSKSRLNELEIKELSTQLDALMHAEKIYLISDLSLVKLADMTESTVNNLSWYLNTHLSKSFYTYINEYRIQAFLEKVYNGEHKSKTLLALAFEVGFNSKSTFNKSFKNIKGNTPLKFIKENELKTYKDIQTVD